MDPAPPTQPVAASPAGLGEVALTSAGHQLHYQYNVSTHRWPEFANFISYATPPPPPPHPGFATIGGGGGSAVGGVMMGSAVAAEAYHSYHHLQVINGISSG